MPNLKNIDLKKRQKRLLFRANHMGIKEADIMIGSFVARYYLDFSHQDCAWFEEMFKETDYDILIWITKKMPPPPQFDTEMMARMQKIDYIPIDHKDDNHKDRDHKDGQD